MGISMCTTANSPAKGTALALALTSTTISTSTSSPTRTDKHINTHQSIPIRIYESRAPDAPEKASGVILTPNGLSILDKLGVYNRIKDHCWQSEYRTYKNDLDETTRKVRISGADLYGYANHRLWRKILLAKMRELLVERGIEIQYQCRFDGTVDALSNDEDENPSSNSTSDPDREETIGSKDAVTFMINGRKEKASLLIGADGIYSAVRGCFAPDVQPEHHNKMGLISHIKTSSVEWPHDGFEKQCTIQSKPGALVLVPEDQNASEIMVARQSTCPNYHKDEFKALSNDKKFMLEAFREGYNEFGTTARRILDAVCENPESLYLWPYHTVPSMKSWSHAAGMIILIGDAAHALPPSSGQGVNQALEDVWTLTLLLKSGTDREKALVFWQKLRQNRIDAIYYWMANGTDVQRMPEAERAKIVRERESDNAKTLEDFDDMAWLYQPQSEQEIEEWIRKN